MEEAQNKTSWGCLKALSIGCSIVILLILVGLVLLWANWEGIQESEWYRSMTEMADDAKEEMGHMMRLRSSLLAEFPADDVTVQVRKHRGEEAWISSLVVNVVNPRFELDEDPGGWEDKAREIALAVAGQYPGVERWDFVTIALVSQKGVGVTFKTSSNHPFPTDELLAEVSSRSQVGEDG